MDPRFFEAWFNAQHVVLGRPLHPFCLQDALILSLAESPFLLGISPGVEYSLFDLQLAAKVCSSSADLFLNVKLDSTWRSRLKAMLWTRRCLKMDLELECQKFVTYIDDYNSGPETWQGDEEDLLRAPWVLTNAVFLMRHLAMTEKEIWRMPLGMALWYAATLAEQLGSRSQLLSEDERKGLEALGKS